MQELLTNGRYPGNYDGGIPADVFSVRVCAYEFLRGQGLPLQRLFTGVTKEQLDNSPWPSVVSDKAAAVETEPMLIHAHVYASSHAYVERSVNTFDDVPAPLFHA